MQTYIQSSTSKSFFDLSNKQWTCARERATAFAHSADAVAQCLRHELSEVQLVLQVRDVPSENDLVMPFR
jgi:hypothetical protein